MLLLSTFLLHNSVSFFLSSIHEPSHFLLPQPWSAGWPSTNLQRPLMYYIVNHRITVLEKLLIFPAFFKHCESSKILAYYSREVINLVNCHLAFPLKCNFLLVFGHIWSSLGKREAKVGITVKGKLNVFKRYKERLLKSLFYICQRVWFGWKIIDASAESSSSHWLLGFLVNRAATRLLHITNPKGWTALLMGMNETRRERGGFSQMQGWMHTNPDQITCQ